MVDLKQHRINVKKQAKYHKSVLSKVGKLKSSEADTLFSEAHEEVFKNFDCLQCANCCKTISPIFENRDIERISAHLGISFADFTNKYLKIDEDQDYVLKSVPCIFLMKDNKCSIYEVRPKACREYPHTDAVKIQKLLTLTQKNIEVCPAVFEIVERVGKKI